MTRSFEPYPGERSATWDPDPRPAEIAVADWVPGTHRLPPDLAAGEHVDWRDVNYLGDRINVLEDWLKAGGDPTERYRIKQGDDHPTWDRAEQINPRDLGARADGVSDDFPAIQTAIDAAVAIGGGTVFLPPGTYQLGSALQLKAGVRLLGAGSNPLSGAVTTIKGTPGLNVIELPASGAAVGFGIENLGLYSGLNGIYAPASASYHTYLRVRGLHSSGQSQSGIEVLSRVEEWDLDNVSLYGGQYGFRYNGMRFDKCSFRNVETRGQSKNGWNVTTAEASQNVTWSNLISHLPAEHAFVVNPSVSIRNWVFINPYFEGTGTSGKSNRTTGSITSGTPNLTVANATGFANGDPIVVQGAGANGADLFTTISAGGGTTALTLAANAATTVTNLNVTNASFDNISLLPGAAVADLTLLGGQLGGDAGGGHVRYTLNAQGTAGPLLLFDPLQDTLCPAYDPNHNVQSFGRAAVRAPNNFLNYNMQYTAFAGPTNAELVRTLIASPPGRDVTLALRDSADNTSGTFGSVEVRKNDANKTSFFQVLATNMEVRSRGRIVEQGIVGQQTLAAGATTIDVTTYSRWRTANTAATTIAAITGGLQPQTIKLLAADAFTSIANSATIKTNTGATKLLELNKVYTFTLFGTVWCEDANAANPLYNVRSMGALGNGTSDDTAIIQTAIDACTAAGGGTVYFPAGTYLLKTWLLLKSNVRLLGEGASSVLYNDKTNATVDKRACVLVGNHHPANMATQTSYILNTITSGDATITATTAGDTANFAVGELAIVGSATNISGVSRHAQLNKILGIAAGVITLKDPIEQTIADARIWKIGGTDASTSTAIYAVENVSIEKLGFKGRSALASKACVFNATFRDLVMLDVALFFGTNMLTNVLVENLSGQYCGRYLEYAMNSYNVTTRNVKGRYTPPAGLQAGESSVLPIHMGEQPFRLFFEDVQCHVDPRFTLNSDLVQAKGSEIVFYRCDFRHGGTAGSTLLTIPDCSYAGFSFDHIVFEECNFAAPNKARIAIIGSTTTGIVNPREIQFKGGQLLEPVTSESIWFQACASSVCSMRDRTGKTINVRATSKYPSLNGYRRA